MGEQKAVAVYDCALVIEEGSEASRKAARHWAAALKDAGFAFAEVDSRDVASAAFDGAHLAIGNALYASAILSTLSKYSAAFLDTLTGFILMGGKLAASGPAPFDTSAVEGAEGRSPVRLRAQMQKINQYTSRTDPWDEICGALVIRALPGVRAARPALRGDRPLPEAGVELVRKEGRPALWELALQAEADFNGFLRLPFPASRITLERAEGIAEELGSAAGPEVAARIDSGAKAKLLVEEGRPALTYPVKAEGVFWTCKAGDDASRALKSQADWSEEPQAASLVYGIELEDFDIPAVPAGGTLRLDLSASAGSLAVQVNGQVLMPVAGDETLFTVPMSLLKEENRIEVRVTAPEEADDDNPPGLYAEPQWQVLEEGELLAFSVD